MYPEGHFGYSVAWAHNEFCYGRLENARAIIQTVGREQCKKQTEDDKALDAGTFKTEFLEWMAQL